MIPAIPVVLAATDFSALADACVPYAYSIVDEGGTVHLIHVVEIVEPLVQPNPLYAHYVPGRAPTAEERYQQHADLAARLGEMIPPEVQSRSIRTEVHVVEGDEAAACIVEAAERLDVSVVCVGSQGRTGLIGALLGSVAREVVRDSRRPVFVVRSPEPKS